MYNKMKTPSVYFFTKCSKIKRRFKKCKHTSISSILAILNISSRICWQNQFLSQEPFWNFLTHFLIFANFFLQILRLYCYLLLILISENNIFSIIDITQSAIKQVLRPYILYSKWMHKFIWKSIKIWQCHLSNIYNITSKNIPESFEIKIKSKTIISPDTFV